MSDLYPFASHYLDLDGGSMHYVDEGDGEVVLMVHGNPTWSFYYRNLISSLRPRFRTVAPDHIGCGRSSKPDDDHYNYTLASRVDDLDKLVSHLDLDRITLVVHDWGGMIGMTWAVRNADKIARLVVLNTAVFHLPGGKKFPPTLRMARSPLGALMVRGCNAFVRGAVRYCVTRRPMDRRVKAGYIEPYASWADRIAVHRFVQDIPLRPDDQAYDVVSDTAANLKGLRAKPMMICWGMKDFVFDHHFLAEWARRFPDAAVHRFEDCGHFVLEDANEEILELVHRFIGEHPVEDKA